MGQVDWNSDTLAGDNAKSWAVMAVLQWNLFDGLVTQSKVKEALATSSRMKSLEAQTRSAVELQVRQAAASGIACDPGADEQVEGQVVQPAGGQQSGPLTKSFLEKMKRMFR